MSQTSAESTTIFPMQTKLFTAFHGSQDATRVVDLWNGDEDEHVVDKGDAPRNASEVDVSRVPQSG